MTCGPEPTTRSAPAPITARAKARLSPRFSPKAISVLRGTWVWSAPSAPACMATTTRSARAAQAAAPHHDDLPGTAGGRHPGPPQRGDGLSLAGGAVVPRVVVGEVDGI